MLAGPDGSQSILARAQEVEDDIVEDVLEDEDEGDATVEADDVGTESTAVEGDAEEEEEEPPLKPSEDANTFILFTKPNIGTDLPAGHIVKFLVGFANKGSNDFVVETMDAAFRYPQDYSFYIQNFTSVRFDKVVEPNREATFEYSFLPSESFSARPMGLTVNLNYKDNEGNLFQDAVFNETVQVVEPDEGLDGETFFLYIFLAAVVVLLLLGVQQLLSSFSKKHMSKPTKPAVEMGTQNVGDIDYDWIPQQNIVNDANKSPRRSPKSKTSPRQRRAKRNAGSEDWNQQSTTSFNHTRQF